jgi:peptidyl-prolyl cis-trans isomerase SurA
MTMFSPTLRFVRWSLLAELGFALACSSSWAQTTQPSPSSGRDFIVAVVDAQPITNHEVNMRANVLSQQLRQQQKPVPQQMDLLRTSLERLITEKALLQHAKEVGITIDNDAVAVAEQRSAAQNQTTVDAMHKKARAEGSSPEALQQGIKDQLTLQRLSERNVPGRIKISDAEIDQAIRDRQSANVDTNPDIELGHVLVAVPESANESQIAALRAKAEAALSRLKRGDDLGVVAKEMSDGAERDKGGLMGVRPANRYPSLFVENTQKLSVGAVSPIFRSGAGFHILKLVSKRSNNTITVTETNARHILLRPGGQLSQTTARAQLTEFKRQIEAGKVDFAKLAQQHSQDASASAGGDLGWVATGMFVPEFEEVMNKLEPGQIADPTVSRFGVHLIQVITRRQAPISERELRDMTRNHLRDKKFEETYQLWAQEVRGRAYVEYRDAPQ